MTHARLNVVAFPNPVDRRIGRRLRSARRSQGVSLLEAAHAAGLSEGELKRGEGGHRRLAASELYRLCGVLDIEPHELFLPETPAG